MIGNYDQKSTAKEILAVENKTDEPAKKGNMRRGRKA